jgi:two-component system, OmpR family, sensor histidine kinase KdpD
MQERRYPTAKENDFAARDERLGKGCPMISIPVRTHIVSKFTDPTFLRTMIFPNIVSLVLILVVTVALFALNYFFGIKHLPIVYLLPVLIAAMRWGLVPALTATIGAAAVSVFFFYPPVYSFAIDDPQHIIELILFLIVAVAIGNQTARLHREIEISSRHEKEFRDLYAFSRRLAACVTAPGIYMAVEEYLSNVLGHRAVLIEPAAQDRELRFPSHSPIPDEVRQAASAIMSARDFAAHTFVEARTNVIWLVRSVSTKSISFGAIAIELGAISKEAIAIMRQQVNTVLAEATTMLERLDVVRVIGEAKMRVQADPLAKR